MLPTVWIVDDSHLQADLGRRALADAYDVRIFTDGATMLEALGSAVPDLLILDWHMPELSGLEVCQFVRQTRDAGVLPILILTTSGGDELSEAFAAGANDFVRKPYSKSELDARVQALVRNKGIHARLAATERRLRVEAEFRERFIGMLAHDLRQPLSTILLANSCIARMAVPALPQVTKLLGRERRAADRMTRMIAELLDFTRSRPETGMPINRQPMDLAAVCGDVIDEMRAGYPERFFRLNTRGPCNGLWDRDRLTQVCTNLIGNAVEHSSSPASPIDVDLVGATEHVELVVANKGLPIPPALLPVLFEAFRQSHTTEGVGLGLYIVHEIARAHGGTVSVVSNDDATVFRVTLPTVEPPASGRPTLES